MSPELASVPALPAAALPPISPVLEVGQLRLQQLLQTIGWSYCVIWLQTHDGGLSWYYGHINRDKEYNALTYSGLEQYSYCTLSVGMGYEGAAMLDGRHRWVSGTNLLKSTVAKQARFFRDACIQTVVCIPYSSGVVELGTTDAVQEDHEFVPSIRRFLSLSAEPALVEVPSVERPPHSQGIPRQISISSLVSEELPYRSDTGSSNSNSSQSEFSRPTSGNSVLSPGLSTPIIADYGFDIFEQLNMDRHTVTTTLTNVPTADVVMRFCTTLPSSLAQGPSTVCPTRERNPTMSGCGRQELSNMHIDGDHTMIPMDMEFGPSSGSFRTELQLLPANAELAPEIQGFPSFQTILDSVLRAPNAAYIQNAPNDFDSRRARYSNEETSNRTSAFKTWTAPTPTSQSGNEKSILAESLWRRWLRYVVPKMRSRAPSPAVQPIGTHHANAMLAARQHMMAERTRRGKQNECFRALRNLTPNLRKKDKVTVLEHTIQYVRHLKRQVEELEEQKRQHQYAFGSHRSPDTEEGVSSVALRQNTAQIAAPARSVSSDLQTVEVTYDASNEPPVYRIEVDVTAYKEASDTLINVLTALKQVKLNAVQIDARYERNTFRAKLSASHQDEGNTLPHPGEVRELLRSVV